MIDYYWCRVEIINEAKNGAYGWCTYHLEEDYAEIYLDPNMTVQEERFSTFVHELGHVWQGLKRDDLLTGIEWPKNHPAMLTPREDFAECRRVAICGLDHSADESLMFEWKKGVYGLYQNPVPQPKLDEFRKKCTEEVKRILGFMPTIPTI